jgi:hypothetical protein
MYFGYRANGFWRNSRLLVGEPKGSNLAVSMLASDLSFPLQMVANSISILTAFQSNGRCNLVIVCALGVNRLQILQYPISVHHM